jgi:hypothetical protein
MPTYVYDRCLFLQTSRRLGSAPVRLEQLLDAAIVSVVGSFLSSSTAVASWVADGEMALRFGMEVSSEG